MRSAPALRTLTPAIELPSPARGHAPPGWPARMAGGGGSATGPNDAAEAAPCDRRAGRRVPAFHVDGLPLGAAPGATSAANRRRDEILAGLAAPAASIAPKYLYDDLGSALFGAICTLPEYYPTRTERTILAANVDAIAAAIGPGAVLVDLGAGDCAKAARLIPALRPRQYVAVDIAAECLRRALETLQQQFPALPIAGVATDFSDGLHLPAMLDAGPRVAFWPGSSIGNLSPPRARAFLAGLPHVLGPGAGLLVGIDLRKDRESLEAAYDDVLGVTAAFNRNVLAHVNRLVGSDFRLDDWRHVARWHPLEGRVSMQLEARRALRVGWPGGGRRFAAGERIHTEDAWKYASTEFASLLDGSGWNARATWTDDAGRYGVWWAEAVSR